MIEDDFESLLTAVAEVFDVPKSEILRKNSRSTAKARFFVAHVIHNGLMHLRNIFVENAGCAPRGFYKSADYADEAIHDSKEDLYLMNEIRAKVGLPKLKRAVRHYTRISDTMTLFGFEYTEDDIRRRRSAIISSNTYMRKLCSIGRKPIPDGLVFAPARARREYQKWYKD